jgi:hypothetical protein
MDFAPLFWYRAHWAVKEIPHNTVRYFVNVTMASN